MIKREIQGRIEKRLFAGKIIVIYGARQVGKTTLIHSISNGLNTEETLFLNCDEPDVRSLLADVTSTQLKALIGSKKIIFIDDAQRVKNIGLTLKLLADTLPERQIVVTGSSSLDLTNAVVEPLTGRKYEIQLHPLSLRELTDRYTPLELQRLLEHWMITGLYPEVVTKMAEAASLLPELASSYLYKDVLQFQDIRKPELLERMLQALALQIGSEVSYNELANTLRVSKETISHYIELLEKSFVIFRLAPFNRNLRNELSKMRKIYFYDLGIRNAIIRNFNPLHLRADVGALWENFLICERLKNNTNSRTFLNSYFWRTHQQQEIDYLEEAGGKLSAFEFKWKPGIWKLPNAFSSAYPDSTGSEVNPKNFMEFLGI